MQLVREEDCASRIFAAADASVANPLVANSASKTIEARMIASRSCCFAWL
jgi:hypothetical protein